MTNSEIIVCLLLIAIAGGIYIIGYVRGMRFGVNSMMPKLPIDDAEPIGPGQKWRLKPDGPWPKDYAPVTILDVQAGWVRYTFGGSMFTDERQTVQAFCGMYERVA